MTLDAYTRSYYELQLKMVYIDRTDKEFQKFFSSVMTRRYPDDFVTVAPWGSSGDLKNDGYLPSERRLFAVYAPQSLKWSSKSKKKITDDYLGAVKHWSLHFDEWLFVHNSLPSAGLGAPFLQLLLDLGRTHAKVAKDFGFDSVRRRLFQLDVSDIADLLGTAPAPGDYVHVSFADIQSVIAHVGEAEPLAQAEIRVVPPEKAKKAKLSAESQQTIQIGMGRADRVAVYLQQTIDPTKGEKLAQTFKNKYLSLAAAGLDPDTILVQLYKFATGDQAHTTGRTYAATWAVLAYFFERCDIFTVADEVVAE